MHPINRFLTGAAVSLLALSPASALAHGEEERTDPENGDRLRRPPAEVTVTLTEPPTAQAQLRVRDGCGDGVTERVRIDGNDIVAVIDDGAARGRWRVFWRAISAIDGHETQGSFNFRVRGQPDCDGDDDDDGEPGEPGDDDDGSEDQDPGDEGSASDGPPEDDSGLPLIPIALGTAGIVGLALAARFATSR